MNNLFLPRRVLRQALFFRLILCAAAFMPLLSCKPKTENLDPPSTPVFLREGLGYGVINQSFAQLLSAPQSQNSPVKLIRKTGIVKVLEKREMPAVLGGAPEGVRQTWVYVTAPEETEGGAYSGWLNGASVDFYENLPQAETASSIMAR